MTTVGQTPPSTTTPVNTTHSPGPSRTTPTSSSADLIQHKLIHKTAAVLQFAGNVGSQLKDMEGFIESYLNSLSWSSPDDSLTQANCLTASLPACSPAFGVCLP